MAHLKMTHWLAALLLTPYLLTAQPRLYDYALILSDPPAAPRQKIQTAQRELMRNLRAHRIPVTGSSQLLLNAVFVHATHARMAELASLPGVVRVQYLPPLHRSLDRAIDLVHATEAWNLVGGMNNAGAGIKIGILDTGIDQNHPGLKDTALSIPAGFPKGDAAFTNNKVIVARSYVSQLPFADTRAVDSRPDDVTPRDRVGHGTAVAMIAAGVRNSGPAATITGVAPKAYVGNYKIYGSPGVNDLTHFPVIIQALEDAIRDGMDIVVLLASDPAGYGPLDRDSSCAGDPLPFGIPSDACDIRAYAVENAVRMGLTIVLPAGNDGASGSQFPTLTTTNTPGTAPSAITVGATTNSHIFYAGVRVTGNDVPANLTRIRALFGDGPKPTGLLTAPLRDVTQSGDNGLACAPLPTGALNGTIALIQRGSCRIVEKVNNAQKAGAVGVVLYQPEGDNDIAVPPGLIETGIPAVLIANSDGKALKDFLATHAGRAVSLDPALQPVNAPFNTIAGFSSRGPTIRTLAIKPELVAVGTDLYTATQTFDPNADMYDATGYTSVGGTSFAAAMAAGAAALVKQKNPGFTPAQIKSALVNTATADVNDDSGPARVTAVGAGKLNAAAAVQPGATVDPATLSFGAIAPSTLPVSLTLAIGNTGPSRATFNLAVAPRDSDRNARVTLSQSSVSLNPGEATGITVRLEGSRPAPGSYEGFIAISGGANLRVPYLYIVGDAVPNNIIPLENLDFTGVVSDPDFFLLLFKVIDRYGVAVPNVPVRFQVTAGGGLIKAADAATDTLGIAGAQALLGPNAGEQIFTATAGGLSIEFDAVARVQPTINTNGVVNAASIRAENGYAPGSYVSIFGNAFSDATRVGTTAILPISLAGASVSFDDSPNPSLSLPGHVYFVSPTQINVQIPWEFQGKASVLMKVSRSDASTALYTVPLAAASPAAFEYTEPASGQRLAAVLDQNSTLVTTVNPARRGQTISIYANGLGLVDRQSASGEPSPGAEPLARTRVNPVVTIGGVTAQISFSGLAPNLVGLYQINVLVPSNVPAGIQPIVITANGVDSKPANMPVQ